MQSENNISKTKGDNGIFSKDEIIAYSNYCNENMPDATMEEICKDIKEEQKRLSRIKDLKQLKEFNNKYIVEVNPDTGRSSYYEKKSGMSIFGEGLKQSFSSNAGRIFPMWLGNYQMSGQLDIMTDQAIYNKQMNYMYDPNSPWMNYNPYFKGNYYGTAEFTGFTNTTMPVTNGFNFSN